jgi:two-component system chemotaxis response regulator CheY
MSSDVITKAVATPSRSSPAAALATNGPAAGRPRFLLVDDNDAFLSAMELLLPRLFEADIVASARSGLTALNLLETEEIDLALVDYKMPGLNGLTFIRRARDRRHWLRILPVTFDPGPGLKEDAREYGADGVINKADIQSELRDYLSRWFGCHTR